MVDRAAPVSKELFKPTSMKHVAPPGAAADPQPGLGLRRNPAVPVIDQIAGIDDSRSQQSQIQVVPAVNGEVLDADSVDMVGLRRLMGIDRRSRGHG